MDGFRIWWFELEPHLLPLGFVILGIALAFVIARLVVRK
jgi:hypothetical protein